MARQRLDPGHQPNNVYVYWRRILVNSQLTPALLLHMTYSIRLLWPQQWHTQTRCADGLLLLHIYSADYLHAPAVVNCEVGSTAGAYCECVYKVVHTVLSLHLTMNANKNKSEGHQAPNFAICLH